MNRNFLRAALVPMTLVACMAPTPHVDRNLGMAATDLRTAQVLNPGADRNTKVPGGIDGVAAKSGYDQYQKSFKAPEKNANSFLIGVGR
ncbi:MAG TPA: hypothetical protein VGD52_27225 [Pseudoduganella sp.]